MYNSKIMQTTLAGTYYCFHLERSLVLTVLRADNGTSYLLVVAIQTGKRDKTATERLRTVEVFISVRFATATVGCTALPSTPEKHRMVPHVENRQHLKMTYIKNKTKPSRQNLVNWRAQTLVIPCLSLTRLSFHKTHTRHFKCLILYIKSLYPWR